MKLAAAIYRLESNKKTTVSLYAIQSNPALEQWIHEEKEAGRLKETLSEDGDYLDLEVIPKSIITDGEYSEVVDKKEGE